MMVYLKGATARYLPGGNVRDRKVDAVKLKQRKGSLSRHDGLIYDGETHAYSKPVAVLY